MRLLSTSRPSNPLQTSCLFSKQAFFLFINLNNESSFLRWLFRKVTFVVFWKNLRFLRFSNFLLWMVEMLQNLILFLIYNPIFPDFSSCRKILILKSWNSYVFPKNLFYFYWNCETALRGELFKLCFANIIITAFCLQKIHFLQSDNVFLLQEDLFSWSRRFHYCTSRTFH